MKGNLWWKLKTHFSSDGYYSCVTS